MPRLINGRRVETVIMSWLPPEEQLEHRCTLFNFCAAQPVATVVQITQDADSYHSSACPRCIAELLKQYCGEASAPERKPLEVVR